MRSFRILFLVCFCTLLGFGSSAAVSAQGNSESAHLCQKGGYNALIGTGGETFANAGACTSYAAHGGTFVNGIIIPRGQTATFTTSASACNVLTGMYTINGGASTSLGNFPGGCGSSLLETVVVGPFADPVLLEVSMEDATCSVTYGMWGNHALVSGGYPTYTVGLADGGGFCERTSVPVELLPGEGNLVITIQIG